MIGFGTQQAPARTKASPTSITATESPRGSFATKNRDLVKMRANVIRETGNINIKPSPERNRCGSGRANGGGGMSVDFRHQRPNTLKTVPKKIA
jgi:hypothetical protein